MTTIVSDLRLAAERLRTALTEYESFLSDWQDATEPLSNDDPVSPEEPDGTMREIRESGVAITNDVLERYHAASDAAARYVQRARNERFLAGTDTRHRNRFVGTDAIPLFREDSDSLDVHTSGRSKSPAHPSVVQFQIPTYFGPPLSRAIDRGDLG